MQLHETLTAAGMTPPQSIAPGKWMRFPGCGKGRSNRAGWCRLITPTLAIYGDWSTGLSEIWRDGSHRDDAESRRLLREARAREVEFLRGQRTKQARVAHEAGLEFERSILMHHPYLERKGFHELFGFVRGERLLVPMRDAVRYRDLINLQQIWPDGTKRFMTGGRAKGAIHRIGAPHAWHTVLCEGYATGLSLDAALSLMSPSHAVIVCFSATNLVSIAEHFPKAFIAADNDHSATGEEAAKRSGLKWTMPYEVGTDFNDLHQNMGLHVVVERMRELLRCDTS